MQKPIAILLMLLAIVAVQVACEFPDVAMEPARPEGPHFDHAAHLLRHARECKNCHGEEDVEWKGMPDLDKCMICHKKLDKDKPEERFAAAFYDDEKKGRWTKVTQLDDEKNFNHARHVKKVEDCLDCHLLVARSTSVPKGARMPMEYCVDCHEAMAPDLVGCQVCHKEVRQDVRPETHTASWLRVHGRQFEPGLWNELPTDCGRCHTRSTCETCHRAEPPRNHTNLWRRYGHGSAAYLARERCQVCHEEDACASCHQSSKPRSHRGGAWGIPFNQHCHGCHVPLEQFGEEGCAECHKWNPSHASAPPRSPSPAHMVGGTPDPETCRNCHMPPTTLSHPDNGDDCLLCHQ